MACAAANPSMPSMKLNRLIDHTMASAPTIQPSAPSSTAPPGQGRAGNPPLASSSIAAAPKWKPRRLIAERPRRSSRKPARATRLPPTSQAKESSRVSRAKIAAAAATTSVTDTIARPPPRGARIHSGFPFCWVFNSSRAFSGMGRVLV